MKLASLTVAALLAACSASIPTQRIEPKAWARGEPISVAVVFPESMRQVEPYLGDHRARLLEALVNDLSTAGYKVIAANDPSALRLVVTPYAGGEQSTVSARVTLRDVEIDRAFVDGRKLDCHSMWWGIGDNERKNLACMARKLVSDLLASQRLAQAQAIAAREGTTAPRRVASARPAAPILSGGKLAVLELRNATSDLTPTNAQYFTDLVRSAALKSLPGVRVMTRENLVVLLQASGKSLENCEGECEVDTGRKIGADAIVSGEIQKLGSLYKLTLRLHDTHEGRLLSSAQAGGATIEELDAAAQRAARELFAG